MTNADLEKKYPMTEIPDAVREAAVAWGPHLFIRDKVKLAQDMMLATEAARNEYAKQVAIGFAEWAGNYRWTYNPMTKLWSNYDDNIERKIQTDQLFEKFLLTLQPKSHE